MRGLGQVENPLRPDDPNGHEQSTLLGSEQIHPPLSEEEEDEDHARQVSSWRRLPWWKRPSPYWLIFGTPFGSIGYTALLAPKVALYTTLVCRVHRPEYITNDDSISFPLTNNPIITNATDMLIPHVSDGSEATVNTVSVHLPDSTYTASLDYTQNDPDSQQKCASDPVVQATVARLSAVFITSMGIITCLTTGWWSSLSDRYGRRTVIFASTFGLFVTDVTHVVTARFVDVLPGGYWFPLVGFLIEGLCGSVLTGVATTHAYLADTTDPSTRSRYFSLLLGLSFTGMAVGPVIGGLLIHTTGTIMSAFYFAFTLHGIYTIFILFLLPESLTRARARSARLRRTQEKADQVSGNRVLGVLKTSTRFFSPLVVLLPEKSSDANLLKRRSRDWNLFFIAIAYGLVTSIIGSVPYRFQYAAAQFHWTPEITSYFISCIGGTRALFLVVILPLVIKYLKPAPVQLPSTQDEPLRGDVGLSSSRGSSSLPGSARNDSSGKRLPSSRSPAFDLALARASMVLDVVVSMSIVVANTGPLYTLAATIGSLAAGFSPAVQALALDIYTNRRSENRGEVGKLFGALSVVQALASQIISPVLYGFVYSNTVAIFPQAILVVSMCTVLLALAFLLFVRIPSEPACDPVIPGDGNEGNQRVETPEILDVIEDEAVEVR